MCLIAVAHRVSEAFPLVIAANRDEFYDRPALPAAPWKEDRRVVGGRDLRAGGSWLAVRDGGRFAAVTNIRGAKADGPSRGSLVSQFVLSDVAAMSFANDLDRHAYAGFHLIVGDGTTVAHVTNANDAPPSALPPGSIFAVSNGVPGEDWPKVELARDAMANVLAPSPRVRGEGPRSGGEGRHSRIPELLLDFLTTRRGGPLEQEVFVVSTAYGTRSSTVITVDGNGVVDVVERTFTAPPLAAAAAAADRP
jgi:uncharacterized protein with NRDE domain